MFHCMSLVTPDSSFCNAKRELALTQAVSKSGPWITVHECYGEAVIFRITVHIPFPILHMVYCGIYWYI